MIILAVVIYFVSRGRHKSAIGTLRILRVRFDTFLPAFG